MTRKRKCGAKSNADASSDEAAEVKAFCSGIVLEEISFTCWQENHSKLDLVFPLKIIRSQLSQTPTAMIRLSRTITITSENGRRVEQRERFECEIALCPNLEDKKVLKYPGLGDRCDDVSGDLLIILQISD